MNKHKTFTGKNCITYSYRLAGKESGVKIRQEVTLCRMQEKGITQKRKKQREENE